MIMSDEWLQGLPDRLRQTAEELEHRLAVIAERRQKAWLSLKTAFDEDSQCSFGKNANSDPVGVYMCISDRGRKIGVGSYGGEDKPKYHLLHCKRQPSQYDIEKMLEIMSETRVTPRVVCIWGLIGGRDRIVDFDEFR